MKALSDVCTIQTGFTARGRLESAADGGVLALQLRDILPNGLIAANGLIRIQVGDISERYLARLGNVVFRSRGERNTAAVMDESIPEPALAILPLMILRPDPQLLSGAYLAWAINQETSPAFGRHPTSRSPCHGAPRLCRRCNHSAPRNCWRYTELSTN
jgi:hypothetical protein